MNKLEQFKMVNVYMPVNSKGFKKELRAMTPRELRTLLREVNKAQDRLLNAMGPVENELMAQTGRYS